MAGSAVGTKNRKNEHVTLLTNVIPNIKKVKYCSDGM